MRSRYANLRRIRTLDPATDFEDIYRCMLRHEFPWDMKLGLNLAFNRSFALPAIAAVLVRTGEITGRTRKRIDDTGLLMYEIVLNGLDHPRSRIALGRINAMHGRYRIDNDLYLYVLACLMVEPTRWLQRYGWRQPCCHEKAAAHAFYQRLGQLMGITDIPDSYDATAAWFHDYDQRHLRPDTNAETVERATRSLMLGRIPRLLAPLGDGLVRSMYDSRFRAAVQAPAPHPVIRVGLRGALKGRAFLLRYVSRPRRVPLFADGIPTRSYPHGYRLDELGTEDTGYEARDCDIDHPRPVLESSESLR